jgi:glycerol-3-phosphate O-acyltransferase/dihydroxyacetone phosphate acyltransferase
MDSKYVYRALRQLSAWTIGGWYSEVYVDGEENVSKAGPLILYDTSTRASSCSLTGVMR